MSFGMTYNFETKQHMCSICFEFYDYDDLWEDADGFKYDVCVACGDREFSGS